MIQVDNLGWRIKKIFENGFQFSVIRDRVRYIERFFYLAESARSDPKNKEVYSAFYKGLEERANLLARNVDVFGSRTCLIEIRELIRRYPTIREKYGWLLDHYPERRSKLLS